LSAQADQSAAVDVATTLHDTPVPTTVLSNEKAYCCSAPRLFNTFIYTPNITH